MNWREIDRLLAQLDVPEDRYRADMELFDRSQGFSSELLKLAMAGIAVVAFFLATIPEVYRTLFLTETYLKSLLIGTVLGFGVSVACTLRHRFLAGGANFHHFRVIKLLMLQKANPNLQVDDMLTDEEDSRNLRFELCHRFLCSSVILIAVSTLLLSAAFVGLILAGSKREADWKDAMRPAVEVISAAETH